MTSSDIVSMYKVGHSIEYIIDQYYRSQKIENRVISAKMRKIILIDNPITKKEIRGQVYKIIYKDLKKI